MAPTLDDVAAVLRGRRFNFASEMGLHEGIALALAEALLPFEREVALSRRDRIDFLVGSVGVEVKVDGGAAAVLAQLARYAEHERVSSVLLVTSRVRHVHGAFPESFNGKPVRAVVLTGSLL